MTKEELYIMYSAWKKKLHLTDKQIAEKLGCSQQNVSNRINKGSIRLVDFDTIIGLYGYHLKIVKKPKE